MLNNQLILGTGVVLRDQLQYDKITAPVIMSHQFSSEVLIMIVRIIVTRVQHYMASAKQWHIFCVICFTEHRLIMLLPSCLRWLIRVMVGQF